MPQLCGDWAQQLAPRRIGRYHGAETIWEPSFERMTEIARDLAAEREARAAIVRALRNRAGEAA